MRQNIVFRDREQAARLLAERLERFALGRTEDRPLVLGVPRGAVPMAKVIADHLHGDLDLVLVHKFSRPRDPEFALGSVTEDGDVYLGRGAASHDVTEAEIGDAAGYAIAKLQAKRRLYTPHRRLIEIAGRNVILVDDGIATGATMISAIKAARDADARRIIVATPVASNEAIALLAREGAEVEVLHVPERLFSVSQFYEDFSQVSDADVIHALSGEPSESRMRLAGGVTLFARLTLPEGAKSLVLFAHGSGSGRNSPRNQFVAHELNSAGIATMLVDLLTETEFESRSKVFDIGLLSDRLGMIEDWISGDEQLRALTLGLFGASTGAAAAIRAAIRPGSRVRAIVSRGGRPDLAADALALVRVPTLLIVGGEDEPVLSWNHAAAAKLTCVHDVAVIAGATHLFEEPGALEEAARLGCTWFARYFSEEKPVKPRLGVDKIARD